MPVAEAELRPKKASFHLKTSDTILAEARAAIGQNAPMSAQARSAVLKVMRQALQDARHSAEADLMAHGRGTRCDIRSTRQRPILEMGDGACRRDPTQPLEGELGGKP